MHIYTHTFLSFFYFYPNFNCCLSAPNHHCSITIQLFGADFDAVLLLLDS